MVVIPRSEATRNLLLAGAIEKQVPRSARNDKQFLCVLRVLCGEILFRSALNQFPYRSRMNSAIPA